MLKNSSEKLNFIPKKKQNERKSRRKSKTFRLPFLISQQKRLFDQNSFTIQMSLGVFQSNGNESRKILILPALTFTSLIPFIHIHHWDFVSIIASHAFRYFGIQLSIFLPVKHTKNVHR
jgi:hypothetical protein